MKKNMTYMDSLHRWGTAWNLSVMVILLLLAAVLVFVDVGRIMGG